MNHDTLPLIRLSPHGTLHFSDLSPTPWQERWFCLADEVLHESEVIWLFWQEIATSCLTNLCHRNTFDEANAQDLRQLTDISLPDKAHTWLDTAPPMHGGEYLSLDMLQNLWDKLLDWCRQSMVAAGSVTQFLKDKAPHWQQVGRVFFHLAENKMSEENPFAFMATYSVGVNEKGHLRHIPLGNALQQYAQSKDNQKLTVLLMPLLRAAEQCAWLQKMLDDKSVYRAVSLRPHAAHEILLSIAYLESFGICVYTPDWWKKRVRPRVQARLDIHKESSFGVHAILEMDICLALGEENLNEKDLQELIALNVSGLVLFKNQWIELDQEKLQQALSHWKNVQKQVDKGEINFLQGMRLLAGMPVAGEEVDELENLHVWSTVEAGGALKELLAGARQESTLALHKLQGLKAHLRPYQEQGVQWLQFLAKLGLGACLADDMGLGKTLQVLTFMLMAQQSRKKQTDCTCSLLIVPASLIGNWQAEIKQHVPGLEVLILHSSVMDKKEMSLETLQAKLEKVHMVITTYGMCQRLTWLAQLQWEYIIADEAQAIKNPQTRQSKAVRRLNGKTCIALTGTPIENNLQDLWALFDFINPGLLGSLKTFAANTKKMTQSTQRFAPLRRLISPYILRRMKTDKSIIADLPDKTEIPTYCHLTKEQAKLYTGVTKKFVQDLQALDELPDDKGRRRVLILQTIILLKQICNHPHQAGGFSGENKHYDPKLSGKFQQIIDLCTQIAEKQERVLVFTQFKEIIAPLNEILENVFGEKGLILHGAVAVKKRQELVRTFQQDDGPPFFILSLKAGGTGLTLTNASHVIHVDRWWNPAVENQATDRAYRIGQKKNVLVHKCITSGTIEEKIHKLIEEKKHLSLEVLGSGNEVDLTRLDDDEIMKLVSLDVNSIAIQE